MRLRGARARAAVHAYTRVPEVPKTSKRLILNDTPFNFSPG